MSWAKRNLYFLICCIVAVVLLIAAGWYCYSSSQANSAKSDELKQAYDQLKQIASKPIGAGNETVNNIEAAKEQTKQVKDRVGQIEKFFTPIRSIPDTTNHIDDRMLSRAVRDTIGQLRVSAQAHNVILPTTTPEFAFSFSLQASKAIYDPNSGDMLAKQLGEVKLLCDTLFSARILALDAVQRERTSDDANPANMVGGNDYTDSNSLTNSNVVITPYQVTFQCFTTELGGVISSFANQQHTIVVKTLNIQPVDMNNMPTEMAGGVGQYGVTPPPVAGRGGLPTVIDEKKIKVTMLLDFVKILPAQGR